MAVTYDSTAIGKFEACVKDMIKAVKDVEVPDRFEMWFMEEPSSNQDFMLWRFIMGMLNIK